MLHTGEMFLNSFDVSHLTNPWKNQLSPPEYNIERINKDEFRIILNTAGFDRENLTIELKENVLSVRGTPPAPPASNVELIHHGFTLRPFEQTFRLANHLQVMGSKLEAGLLHIDLKREVPEHARPKTIPIN